MDPRCAVSQTPGSKVKSSEVVVVWMGQYSKPTDTLIIPDVAANKQHLPQMLGCIDNQNLSLNDMWLVLVCDQVCDKTFLPIFKMAVHMIEFGGDSTLQDHKNIVNDCVFYWSARKPFGFTK